MFNVFASYGYIPSAYNNRLGFIYWAYPDNYGRSIVYEINVKSPSVISKTTVPGSLYNLVYDGQDNKVYGILSPPSPLTDADLPAAGTPSFIQMSPANVSNYKTLASNLPTSQSTFIADVSPITHDYYFGTGNKDLYSIKLTGSGLTTHHLNCSTRLVAIFNTKERGLFYGVDASSRIVSVDLRSTPTCHNLYTVPGSYYTSAFDYNGSELAVVTQSGLFIYNTHTKHFYEVKNVAKYTPEYFTALHFAS
eukprot:TRINITY_DN914_c0_g1_i2.p1 TRINITY_DN914_c0_g1~~TRINITY_DN914_c0_g1_i2.p1  ORF type:complete len:250 (-),score=46.41 TRINITY_DN914_c0_g1_i2:58-807(-)